MVDHARRAWLEGAMEQWEKSLLRMCYAYLQDVSLAEDAVQETFLKAWKGFDCFRGASEEKTWLMRIAINTCKDLRRNAWFRRIDRSASLDSLPEASEPFTFKDDTVVRAVMKLKPKFKEVVLLRWYQGLSADETAVVLGVSRSTIFNRLKGAHGLLHRELEDWFHED